MVVQNVLCLTKNPATSCQRKSWDVLVVFWKISIRVRVAEICPKSRDHSLPSSETEKIMLLYFKLNVYEKAMDVMFLINCINRYGVDMLLSEKEYFLLLLAKVRVELFGIGGEALPRKIYVFSFS